MVYSSIWCDTYYTTDESPFEYVIKLDEAVVFAGRAYRYPEADEVKININKICENYLQQNIDGLLGQIPPASPQTVQTIPIPTFNLFDGDGRLMESYRFIPCWDYETVWTGQNSNFRLSDPIDDNYAAGMAKLNTAVVGDNIVNFLLEPTVNIDCVDYALYYLNAKGGWDAFAIQGASRKIDNITSYTTDHSFNNRTMEFETMRNVTEIKTTYELNTHYLSDEQSERLAKHLLGSNMVYLHNLKDGTIKPVVIEDKQVNYQTYQTNGKKLAQYKITVSESQIKRRRK